MHLIELLLVLGAAAFQPAALAQDGRSLAASGNAIDVALGGALAAGAWRTHDDWHDELRGQWYIDHPSQVTDVYGSSSFNLPAAISLWSVGHVAGRPRLEHLGNGVTRTLILTQFVAGPIKLAAHRERPDGSDHLSFPSGHAANTFAVARYLQRQYGTTVALLPYALAVTTALGRMEGNRHYLSDVVMGASLGYVVGNSVALAGTTAPRPAAWRLEPMIGAAGLRFVRPLR